MKVKELAKKINDHLKTCDFKRVHTHKDFHEIMRAVVRPYLAGHPLTLDTWRIRHTDDYEGIVMQYSRDFKKHRNCRYADRGNFANVRVEVENTVAEREIEDLKLYFERRRNLAQMGRIKAQIIEAEDRLEKLNKELEALQEHD